MSNAITLDHATVSYRAHVALRDLSLHIPSGAFCAVIGPNGAGKTTLLTLVNGLGRLIRGRVDVGGVPLTPQTMRDIQLTCGYVPQQSSVDPRMPFTVREVAAMGRCGIRGTGRRLCAEDHAAIDEALRDVGLADLAHRPIGHLSGGERQKVSVARALAQAPSVLLLDEPTANLDPRACVDIMRIVGDYYRRTHCTTVMVTHSLDHVPSHCTQAVLVKDGRLEAEGAPDDVLCSESLSRLYGVNLVVESRDGLRFAYAARTGGSDV